MITWFPCPSFPQTQIQRDRWCFLIKFLRRGMETSRPHFLCVCPVIDHEFRHNSVKLWRSADYFDNVMTKFIVNNRTDALKTDINLFFTIHTRLSNFPLLFADASHEFQIHVSVRILTIKFSQWARVNFFSYRKKNIWFVLPFSNFSGQGSMDKTLVIWADVVAQLLIQ